MITGVSEDVKQALSGSGLCGFTLQETGTLLAWSDRVENGSLIFATSGASRGRAYVRGSQNPVFSQADGTEYYTNVLVGFSTVEQYKRDMAMRSYAILMTPDGPAGDRLRRRGGAEHLLHCRAERRRVPRGVGCIRVRPRYHRRL